MRSRLTVCSIAGIVALVVTLIIAAVIVMLRTSQITSPSSAQSASLTCPAGWDVVMQNECPGAAYTCQLTDTTGMTYRARPKSQSSTCIDGTIQSSAPDEWYMESCTQADDVGTCVETPLMPVCPSSGYGFSVAVEGNPWHPLTGFYAGDEFHGNQMNGQGKVYSDPIPSMVAGGLSLTPVPMRTAYGNTDDFINFLTKRTNGDAKFVSDIQSVAAVHYCLPNIDTYPCNMPELEKCMAAYTDEKRTYGYYLHGRTCADQARNITHRATVDHVARPTRQRYRQHDGYTLTYQRNIGWRIYEDGAAASSTYYRTTAYNPAINLAMPWNVVEDGIKSDFLDRVPNTKSPFMNSQPIRLTITYCEQGEITNITETLKPP